MAATTPHSEQVQGELAEYERLMVQIRSEQPGQTGYAAKALNKHLALTQQAYHLLLWQWADYLLQPKQAQELRALSPLVISKLNSASEGVKAGIAQDLLAANSLEKQISEGKKRLFNSNQAPAKTRLEQLQWQLYLLRQHQEQGYLALYNNSKRLGAFGQNVSGDMAKAQGLLLQQADILAGLIGINEDKLLKLEKSLSVVRSESATGKKLIADIALKNLEIQDYAKRLQRVVEMLSNEDIATALYKKTIIQAKKSLSADMLDERVVSHLITEWWHGVKKWFKHQAPTIISNSVTFFGILLLAYVAAVIARKAVRGLFRRAQPNMSQLAKKFIESMTLRVIVFIGFLFALSNLGIQIGPILAGLGILGFIIGFALQETLSNFASGLMILIYRPFDVGDKIRVSGLEGRVSKMNLVSTTVFTSANHHLTVPNNKIWKDTIHNITSQPQVRLDVLFKVPFSADSQAVLTAIKEEVSTNTIILQDKGSQVRIYELGESEVKYIARFWIASDLIDEAKWQVSEGVKRRFDDAGISGNIVDSYSVRPRQGK
ncbi:mechanosensitive ion channel family protein [Motilimonas pumila]|nr:mechanosensitive ion channel family protein [Motilimonas pumila]